METKSVTREVLEGRLMAPAADSAESVAVESSPASLRSPAATKHLYAAQNDRFGVLVPVPRQSMGIYTSTQRELVTDATRDHERASYTGEHCVGAWRAIAAAKINSVVDRGFAFPDPNASVY